MMKAWLFKGFGPACLAVAVLALPAGAQAPRWRPPLVLWTAHPHAVGFYMSRWFFSDQMTTAAFKTKFGRPDRHVTDSVGFDHLHYYQRGVEVVATGAGQVLSFTFYTTATPTGLGNTFRAALLETDTGLFTGATWEDVERFQGPPVRQRIEDGMTVLEYSLKGDHALDFYFKAATPTARLQKITLF